MKKENLSEEKYQKFRKVMKITGIISIVIGLALIIYGIFCGSEIGPLFIGIGILIILALGTLIFDSRKFAAYLSQGAMPINKEVAKEISKSIKEGLKDDESKDA